MSSSSGAPLGSIPKCRCCCDCFKGVAGSNPPVQGVEPCEGSTGGDLKVPTLKQSGSGAYNYDFGNEFNYSNAGEGEAGGQFGAGWSNHDVPYLEFNGEDAIFQQGATQRTVYRLDETVGSNRTYEAPFFVQDVLQYDGTASVYRLFQPDGTKLTFHSSGRLLSRVNANGDATTFNYTGSRLDSVTNGSGSDARTYLYTWDSDRLASTTLRVGDTSSSAADVRKTVHAYNGEGELEQVTLSEKIDGEWEEIETCYFRYDEGGEGLVRYVLGNEACEQMRSVDPSYPAAASDELVAEYADKAYTYYENRRVETVATHGGRYTYTFAYSVSPHAGATPNVWTNKTVVTQPDGSVHVFYYNRSGNLMLQKVAKDSDLWYPVCQQFDEQARVILKVVSSAVDEVNEAWPHLFTLKENAGQNTILIYDGSSGNLAITELQEGNNANPVYDQTIQSYTSHTVGGIVTWHPSSQVVYCNVDGSGATDPAETSYSYEWHEVESVETAQMSQRLTYPPSVPGNQNGSDGSNPIVEHYDIWGFLMKRVDRMGTATTYEYDLKTGALKKRIEDEGGGRMNLTTDYLVDRLGRTIQELGPEHTISLNGVATLIRRAAWTQYLDAEDEVRTIQGYRIVGTGENIAVSPIRISRRNVLDPEVYGGRMDEDIAVAFEGEIDPEDPQPFTRGDYVRWSTEHYDKGGEKTHARVYHLIPGSGLGEAGTNYAQTSYVYDVMGRVQQVIGPGGDTVFTGYNAMGWVRFKLIGTAGDHSPNLNYEYDGGATSGDGNLTKLTVQVDDNTDHERVTEFTYDWRNRQVTASANDGVRTIFTQNTYDNRNNVIRVDEYLGAIEEENLLNRAESFFDALNQLYRTKRYGVDVEDDGNVLDPLTSETYYDWEGRVIRSTPAGKVGFTVNDYDALGRTTKTFHAYGPALDMPYDYPGDLSTSVVLSQTETTYDEAGNVIASITRQRFDNATGDGELVDPDTEPKARVSYVATYPDGIGRTQAVANYGTNEAETWTRPATVPLRENIVTSGASRTTRYEYNVDSNLTKLIAENAVTGDQTTEWVYGVTPEQGSKFSRNTLVYQKIYPDAGTVTYTYNRQAQVLTMTDQAETVHEYGYDKFGRLLADTVTAFGEGVDDTVKKITRSYEARGMLEKVTSLDIVEETDVVLNEVQFAYNAYSQMIADYQEHDGAVNTGSTLKVGYTYADGSENTVRRTGIVYPDTTQIDIIYDGTAADALSRPDALEEDATPLCTYRYLGSGMIIGVKYDAASNVELTYEGGGTGDAGDQYTGLDRFGRLVETIWKKPGSPDTILVHSTYGRNDFGGVVWRRDEKAHALSVATEDHYYTYDALYQVNENKRGTLAGSFPDYTGITTPTQQENWTYDQTGNWTSYTDTNPANSQARTHNTSNQILTINDTEPTEVNPTYDPAGNMLTMPTAPGASSATAMLVWDAWNRLVSYDNGEDEITYRYDGLTRRLVKTIDGGESRHYYYNDQWRALEERVDGAEEDVDRQYTWGLRDRWDLVRRKRSVEDPLDEVSFCLKDYLDPVAVIEADGDIIERYAYDAFGTVRFLAANFGSAGSSACEWEFLFHAEFRDIDTNLYNYGYRYYNSELGRWLSRDPLASLIALNRYIFAANIPSSMLDLYGGVEWHVEQKREISGDDFNKFGDTHTLGFVLANPVHVRRKQEMAYEVQKTDQGCYYAIATKPYIFSVNIQWGVVKEGVVINRTLVDKQTTEDVTKHEEQHIEILRAFVDSVVVPYEKWSESYRSNFFSTREAAENAAKIDTMSAAMEYEKWVAEYRQDSLTGHTKAFAQQLKQDDPRRTNDIGQVFRDPNPAWGGEAKAKIGGYKPNFDVRKQPGTCGPK